MGIDEVHGEVMPADKLQLVEKLQKEGCVVTMAYDGINDAPTLAGPMWVLPWVLGLRLR